MFNTRIKYNTQRYKFKELVQNLYQIKELDNLHSLFQVEYLVPEGLEGLGKDTDSKYHSMFYNKIRSGWNEFTDMYSSFIKEYVIPNTDPTIEIYQTFPSYRIQYPHSKAITTLHHDNDINHKHPFGEINILLPITKMFDSNTIWAESKPDAKDFAPMNTDYGEIIIWNGNKCNHFNKANETGKTRISMDFRVLPNKYYNPNYELNSATTGKKFIIGDYYSKITK